jgi:hypothetical protein
VEDGKSFDLRRFQEDCGLLFIQELVQTITKITSFARFGAIGVATCDFCGIAGYLFLFSLL